MLVHSFSPSNQWFDAFALFAKQFGFEAEPGKLMLVGPDAKPPLYLGWVCGDLRFLTAREIDSVYKIIELVGTSAESWEKAAKTAVEQAGKSLRGLRVEEIIQLDMQLRDRKAEAYRAKVKVSFKFEGTG